MQRLKDRLLQQQMGGMGGGHRDAEAKEAEAEGEGGGEVVEEGSLTGKSARRIDDVNRMRVFSGAEIRQRARPATLLPSHPPPTHPAVASADRPTHSPPPLHHIIRSGRTIPMLLYILIWVLSVSLVLGTIIWLIEKEVSSP